MSSTRNTDLDNRQFHAWGVVIQGESRLSAVHVANGLIQVLRALPELCAAPPSWGAGDESIPRQFDLAVQSAIKSQGEGSPLSLSLAASSLCITSTKDGPVLLSEESSPAPAALKLVEAGRAHLRAAPNSLEDLPTRREHERISLALNADGRVYASGGCAPTTPGFSFVGYDSLYTLKPMLAGTFLSVLAHGAGGELALERLMAVVSREDDVHTNLVQLLGLAQASPPLSLGCIPRPSAALPYPQGAHWEDFGLRLSEMTSRLLSWAERGLTKQETLMAIVDLIGLSFFLRMLGLAPGGDGALLLIGMGAPGRGDRIAVETAKRTLRAAMHRLDQHAAQSELCRSVKRGDRDVKLQPSTAARALALATGWLYPRDARGGARHFLCPGARQLVTLTQCLVEPEEDLAWSEFHKRALSVGIALGGAQEVSASEALGVPGSRIALRRAGQTNQALLISLGLARRESDNIVRVTGGL